MNLFASCRAPISPRGALALLLVAVSCVRGARAPSVEPRGVLAPSADPAAGDQEGPFGVVFGSPKGETGDPTEISLVFNRPMRAIELAGAEGDAPARISPRVAGAWRWIGTSALVFT